MIECTVQFDFSLELFDHLVLDNLCLDDLLQGHNEARLGMSSQIDLPEFALTELLVHFETIDQVLFGDFHGPSFLV